TCRFCQKVFSRKCAPQADRACSNLRNWVWPPVLRAGEIIRVTLCSLFLAYEERGNYCRRRTCRLAAVHLPCPAGLQTGDLRKKGRYAESTGSCGSLH